VWRTLTLAANIQPYEQAPLYAKVAGYVATMSVDIGDRVRKNEVLVRLDIPEMEQQLAKARSELGERRAELAKAETEAKLATVIHERSRALRREKAITEQDLDEAEARAAARAADLELAHARVKSAESSLAALQALAGYAEIRAPYDGIIVKRFVDPGALVPQSTSGGNASPIVVIGRADRLRAVVDVPEPDALAIREGEPAILETGAPPGKKFEGKVSRFARALDMASRTMRTEIDLPNDDGELLAGMLGSLTIHVDLHDAPLTLPEGAVKREPKRTFVYVVDGGRAREQAVRTGLEIDGRTEILEGIQADQLVIVSPPPELSEGTEVKTSTSS